MKVISFLASLGPQYESAKNMLLTSADFPALNATFFRLSRLFVEDHQSEDQDGGAAMTVASFPKCISTRRRGRGRGFLGRRGGRLSGKVDHRQCDFCLKSGHTEDKCWSKHGKSDWAAKNEPSTNGSTTTTALAPDSTATPANVTLSWEDFDYPLKLAHGDTDLPSAALASSGIPSNSWLSQDKWLVDSNATDHMTSTSHHFVTYTFWNPLMISLADGSKVPAYGKGSVYINQNFYLHDVLLVPSFPTNLLSVKKLHSILLAVFFRTQ